MYVGEEEAHFTEHLPLIGEEDVVIRPNQLDYVLHARSVRCQVMKCNLCRDLCAARAIVGALSGIARLSLPSPREMLRNL